MARPLRKKTFLKLEKKKSEEKWPLSSRGGGGKALLAWPLEKKIAVSVIRSLPYKLGDAID